jgi:hypothetical protein
MIGLFILGISGLVLGWWSTRHEELLDYRNMSSEVWSGDED